jgi:hypothetical protein
VSHISITDLARELSAQHGDSVEEAERGVRVLADQIVAIDGEGALTVSDLTDATADVIREAYRPESQREDRITES